jgi:futalosine hydrolase
MLIIVPNPADCENYSVERFILIIAAVTEELAGLRDRMDRFPEADTAEGSVIRGRLSGQAVGLLETGPGLINTARALTAAIEAEKPALVVQTGCAGAFAAADLALGDIGIASVEIDAQLGIEIPDAEPDIAPLPFRILKKGNVQVRNRYPIEPNLVENTRSFLRQALAETGVHVKTGPFITVSTITSSDLRAEKYYQKYEAIMENMEGAAAAHVCIYYDIPLLEIRSAGNFVGRRDKNNWDLPLAFGRASQAVCTVIKAMASWKIRS